MSVLRYRCFGLSIDSEVPLIEFLESDPGPSADIVIRRGEGIEALWRETGGGEGFRPAPGGGFAMHVEGVTYRVRGGREITVEARPGADPGLVRLYLLGSALGMALHQRGMLVLHGATVESGPGEAAMFVGDSGEGKSTLAAVMAARGRAVFGDDTMPVGPGGEVWPGSRVFKLWSDTLALVDAGEPLEPLANRLDKFFCGNPRVAPDRPALLARLYLLEASDGGEPRLEPVEGLEALRVIAAQTYRPEYLALLGREAEHFRQCAALARLVDVRKLVRPWDAGRLGETADLLERHWQRESGAPGERAAFGA